MKGRLIVYLYYATFDVNFKYFSPFSSLVKIIIIVTSLQVWLFAYCLCFYLLFKEMVKSNE